LKVIGVSVKNMPGRYTLDDVDNMKDEDFGVVKVFLKNGECRLFLYDKKAGSQYHGHRMHAIWKGFSPLALHPFFKSGNTH
jgi:hypothetical protein